MPDNRVDSILLEIEATTDKADGGIDKVTKALTSMKKITEGLDTEKLKQILDVMRGFSGVGDDLKNAGSGMRSIASSIKSLSGVDTAKLKEVAATVKEVSTALGNLGSNNRVSIRIDSEGAQQKRHRQQCTLPHQRQVSWHKRKATSELPDKAQQPDRQT